MGDVLVVGDIGLLGPELVDQLVDGHRLVAACATDVPGAPSAVRDRRVRSHKVAYGSDEFARLFDIYSFDCVLYVSGFLDGADGMPGEQDILENIIAVASHAGVEKFVYITGPAWSARAEASEAFAAERRAVDGRSAGIAALAPKASTPLRARQQEELCRSLLGRAGGKAVVLRVPFVADPLRRPSGGGLLAELFDRVERGDAFALPYDDAAPVDLITPHDLGVLLRHVIEEPNDADGAYDVSSGYRRTWGDLARILSSLPAGPAASDAPAGPADAPLVTCAEPYRALPAPLTSAYPVALRAMYGWIPFDDAFESVEELYGDFCRRRFRRRRRTVAEVVRGFFGRFGFLRYFELIALFALVQFALTALGSNIYFRFIDLRLLFVVLMGTMHGLRFGLLASLLACCSLAMAYVAQGTDLLYVVLRVENWLPFALYTLVGAVTGYVSDKKSADIAFAREEFQLLKGKYEFLNEVYTKAVENKTMYKRQILGFEDSFGRIFSVVRKLDDVMPQKLYLRSLEALEDVLKSRSIALYSVGDVHRFGRLMACSEPLRGKLAKSAEFGAMADLLPAIERREVWRNTQMRPGLPCYACGSFNVDRLQMVVCVWEAAPDQYDMRFVNLLKIMCGLLDVSFRRATEYTELARDDLRFPGTSVMRAEHFAKVLEVQRQMGEQGVADFVLLRFPGLTVEKAQELLVPVLRATDEVGVGSDGCLCALMRQVRADNLAPAVARIEALGLAFEKAEG